MLMPYFTKAQNNDAALWAGVEIEKNINRKLAVYIAPQIRINENYSEIGSVFSDFGLSYEWKEWLKISANYRYNRKYELENYYGTRHRFYADVQIKKTFDKITVTDRVRFQNQFQPDGDDAFDQRFYIRNKVTIKYDLENRFTPSVFCDVWYGPLKNEVNNLRAGATLSYEIDKYSKLGISYFVNKPILVKRAMTSWVTALSYSYSF
jgi:hypothetical protein